MKKYLLFILFFAPTLSSAGGAGFERFHTQVNYSTLRPKADLSVSSLTDAGYSNINNSINRNRDSAEVLVRYKPSRFSVDVGWVYLGKADLQLNLTAPAGRSGQQIAEDLASSIKRTPSGNQALLGATYHYPITSHALISVGAGMAYPLNNANTQVQVNNSTYDVSRSSRPKLWSHIGMAWRVRPRTSLVLDWEHFDGDKSLERVSVGFAYRF